MRGLWYNVASVLKKNGEDRRLYPAGKTQPTPFRSVEPRGDHPGRKTDGIESESAILSRPDTALQTPPTMGPPPGV